MANPRYWLLLRDHAAAALSSVPGGVLGVWDPAEGVQLHASAEAEVPRVCVTGFSPTSFWLFPPTSESNRTTRTRRLQPALTHPGPAVPLAVDLHGMEPFNARPTLPEPHQSFLLQVQTEYSVHSSQRSLRRLLKQRDSREFDCERFPGLLRPNLRRCRRLPRLPSLAPREPQTHP